jgi:N-acetyl-anhydromuramyl-L-alanine amidase AmpD
MATSPDHPQLQFVQAKSYGRGRPGRPLWIVVHDMEAGETRTRAEVTAAYFANLSDGRSVSSHYCVDDNSVVQCVLLKDTAYTVGNSQGNGRGINWELSGFASQSRAQWLDPFGLAMFAQMAPYVRADAQTYGIPLEKRTVAELRAMKPGITSHNDLRLAFGGTTHTDPGPNFPWDVFLDVMRGGDMALDPEETAWVQSTSDRVGYALIKGEPVKKNWTSDPDDVEDAWIVTFLRALDAKVDQIAAPVVTVDPEAIKQALLDPEVQAAIAKAVNDDAAARMAD